MCYTAFVQTPFYACGFLYSLKHNKILLLQSKAQEDQPCLYSMLGGEGIEGEEALVSFQRIVNKLLNVNIKSKDIHPVYDYCHSSNDKPSFVFYADIKNIKNISGLEEGTFSWLKFSETIKLKFNTQTKQDMVIGERVINAKLRDLLIPVAV